MFQIKRNLSKYRRLYYCKRRKCSFVHVPKAAVTSISNALYVRSFGHFSAAEIRLDFPRAFGNIFVFSIVRNPWDRIVSAYRFAASGGTESVPISNPELYHSEKFSSF